MAMYDKQDLKMFLFLILMTLLNLFVFVGVYLFMAHGDIRTASLVITGFDVILFIVLIGVGIKEGDNSNK